MKKRFLAILAVVATVLALVIPMGEVSAFSHPGANTSALGIIITATPTISYNHATITYQIQITNDETILPKITADVNNIVVKFFPPDQNGVPTLLHSIIFPAFNMVHGQSPVDLTPQLVTLNLNSGIVNVIARASFAATALTDPVDVQVSGSKDIPVTIISPSTTVTITP